MVFYGSDRYNELPMSLNYEQNKKSPREKQLMSKKGSYEGEGGKEKGKRQGV